MKAQNIKLTFTGGKVVYATIPEALEKGDILIKVEVLGEPYEIPEDCSWETWENLKEDK